MAIQFPTMPPTPGKDPSKKPMFSAANQPGIMPVTPGFQSQANSMGGSPPNPMGAQPTNMGAQPTNMGPSGGPSTSPPAMDWKPAAAQGMARSPMMASPMSGSPPSPMGASPMSQGMTAQAPMGAPSYGTNGGNARYGTDNAPPGGIATPPPGGNTNPAWTPQDGVSPFNASSGATGIGDFQRFSDNAYNESMRRLNPQFEEGQRGFEQDMVNRGLSPGTEAYDNARSNFDQSRNDATATARAMAPATGTTAS